MRKEIITCDICGADCTEHPYHFRYAPNPSIRDADICRACHTAAQESEFEPEPFCYINVYKCGDSIIKSDAHDNPDDAEIGRRGDETWVETVALYRKAKPEPVE